MNQTIENRMQSVENELKEIRKELEESLARYKQSQYPFNAKIKWSSGQMDADANVVGFIPITPIEFREKLEKLWETSK